MAGSTLADAMPDARFELRVRQLAPPLLFALIYAAFSLPSLAAAGRVFLSMWLHELGHTVSAWLCGFAALPGPWRTRIPETRSWWMLLLWLAALGWLGWRVVRRDDDTDDEPDGASAARLGERARAAPATSAAGGGGTFRAPRPGLRLRGSLLAVLGAAVAVLLLWRLPPARASQLILFCGDGGGMVLGVVLMACFFVPYDHYLHHTHLRWGLFVIGAAGYVDPARGWLRADDHDTIAFGHIEGVGDSDPSRLVDQYGWSVDALVSRYQTLLWLCAVALVLLYVRGVLVARRDLAREPVPLR